ncbi:MAG: hypothetical protein IPP86_02455 [Bacteroidetes bacterium]|nr:hypothetical protein [Bacteroidota bacterium]
MRDQPGNPVTAITARQKYCHLPEMILLRLRMRSLSYLSGPMVKRHKT